MFRLSCYRSGSAAIGSRAGNYVASGRNLKRADGILPAGPVGAELECGTHCFSRSRIERRHSRSGPLPPSEYVQTPVGVAPWSHSC